MSAATEAAVPLIQIKCRWTGAVQFEGRFGSLRLCVEAAVKAHADLAGADLAGADLAGADLAGAYLAGANLADANLADANLARADLAGANLADANLADANLARAYLAGANLADANLADANLARAYLAGAYLARANLAGAYLAGANLADANLADARVRFKDGTEAALIGARPVMQIGPIGSRAAMLSIFRTDVGLIVQTGCFGPAPLAEFEAAVTATHGDNQHAQAYRAAVAMARVAMEAAP